MLRPSATSTGVSIGYNGDGTRVSETVAGITTQYLVDEHNPTGYSQVVEELRGSTVQQRYSYGHDLISQTMVGAGATSFYSDDGLGSVRALTNSAGSITDRYAYDAFGTTLATTGSTANAYRFTGAQQDAALGMYYLRARYYQAGSGRFWTRDSWALDPQHPREWNRYVYVAADPVNGVDPRGYTLSFSYSAPLRTVALPSAATITKVAILVFATFIVATVSYCAALGDDYILCARTGKDKNDTDTLRWARQEAKRTGQDICTILAAAKAAATDPVEIDAIDYAQKIAKCRNRKKR